MYDLTQFTKTYEEIETDEERREMAANMLADDEPIEKIIKYSHLSEKDVLEIKASLEH